MIQNIISDYEENKISLNKLISDLSQLYNLLNFSEVQWDKKFMAALLDLESVNSDILTKGENSPNKNLYQNIVESSLSTIRMMAVSKIEQFTKLINPE